MPCAIASQSEGQTRMAKPRGASGQRLPQRWGRALEVGGERAVLRVGKSPANVPMPACGMIHG